MAASRFPGGQKYARVRRAFGGPQLVESGETSPVTSFNTRTGAVTLTQDDTLNSLSLTLTGNALEVVRVNAAETGLETTVVVGVTDGDKGDIVVSSSGTAWNFDSSVVSAFARTILDDADAASVRTTIGAAAATHTHVIADVTGLQAALDAKLDDTQASAFGLTLLDDADAATARSTLGLVIGTNVQAYDADLTTWAGVTPAAGITTFLATPTSANLRSAVTDETGTGNLVFSASPTFTGTATFTALTATALVDAAATIRATGATAPAAGTGVEMGYSGGIGFIFACTRGAFAWNNLSIQALEIRLATSAGTRATVTPTALDLASGITLKVNGTQVVTSRRTGWAAASGTATRTTFNTATVTTAELAERVKALIDDLTTHGLIGA